MTLGDLGGAAGRYTPLVYDLFRHPARAFDWLHEHLESARQQRRIGSLLAIAFLLALVAIEAERRGIFQSSVLPRDRFYAAHLAFTLLLLFEVVGLVMSLAHSVSESVGKQLEIFSLILLRQTFEELSSLGEPVAWAAVSRSIGHMLSDTFGALLVFVLVGVFYRAQRHLPITADLRDQDSFVAAKKTTALLLLLAFVLIGLGDLAEGLGARGAFHFFDSFYTLLIFSDILLVLISLRYSATYQVVFRNSGFAAATVLMRLALTAPPYFNAALGLSAAVFVCALTFAYNGFAGTGHGGEAAPP